MYQYTSVPVDQNQKQDFDVHELIRKSVENKTCFANMNCKSKICPTLCEHSSIALFREQVTNAVHDSGKY